MAADAVGIVIYGQVGLRILFQASGGTPRDTGRIIEGELYDIVYAVAFPIHDQSGAAIGTFNFRMLPETYQENMCSTFTEDVQRALENFGL